MGRSETKKVDDLGGEEDDEAGFGGVVEGEDDVGDAGREHCGEEEVIFREGFCNVKEAEGDAADAEEGEEVAIRGEKAEGDVDEEKGAPDDNPEDFRALRVRIFGGVGVLTFRVRILVRMDTIRSRN